MLEFLGLFLLLMAGAEWLVKALSKRPDASFRVGAMGCGLLLVVGMTAGGISMLSDPRPDTGEAVLFFVWAVAGVVLMVKARRR